MTGDSLKSKFKPPTGTVFCDCSLVLLIFFFLVFFTKLAAWVVRIPAIRVIPQFALIGPSGPDVITRLTHGQNPGGPPH